MSRFTGVIKVRIVCAIVRSWHRLLLSGVIALALLWTSNIEVENQTVREGPIVNHLPGLALCAPYIGQAQQSGRQFGNLDAIDRQPKALMKTVTEVQVLRSAVGAKLARSRENFRIEHGR
jgi:hypothetical protein